MALKKTILVCVIFSITTKVIIAQKCFQDAVAWNSISAEQVVNKKWDAKAIVRSRLGENFTQLNSWYADLGIQYSLPKNISISLHAVYAPYRDNRNTWQKFHQYYISINAKRNIIKHLSINDRIIIQRSSSGAIYDTGDPSSTSLELRNKLGVDYKINKKYSAFIDDEILFPISYSKYFEINRNRLYAGLNRTISKRTNVDLYFVLQSSYHSSKQNSTYYIYGLDLNFKLKKIKIK